MSPADRPHAPARLGEARHGVGREGGELRFFRRRVTLDEIPVASLARLYAWWNGQLHGRAMPARKDFTPADVAYMLGCLHLVDVEGAPVRFRFRLTGSETVLRLGFDPTGGYVDDIRPREYAEFLRETYLEAVAARTPICNYVHFDFAERSTRYVHLLLPLSDDGARINMLMIGASGNREWHDAFRELFETGGGRRR